MRQPNSNQNKMKNHIVCHIQQNLWLKLASNSFWVPATLNINSVVVNFINLVRCVNQKFCINIRHGTMVVSFYLGKCFEKMYNCQHDCITFWLLVSSLRMDFQYWNLPLPPFFCPSLSRLLPSPGNLGWFLLGCMSLYNLPTGYICCVLTNRHFKSCQAPHWSSDS